MNIEKPNKISLIRYLASSFFIITAIINLIDSLTNSRATMAFDLTFLAIALLPLLINKRLFIMAYGLIASFVSLIILLIYSVSAQPSQPGSYALGLVVFLLALASSLALAYVGMYSKEKGRFKLV